MSKIILRRQSGEGLDVFCHSFRHWRTGKRVFPKRSKVFRFRIKSRK